MAIKLIANYSKRLGLPGYSSHQFSVSIETELVAANDIPGESARLYHLLQSNVDEQILVTGFVPPHDYGLEPAKPGDSGSSPRRAKNVPAWRCTDRQRGLILSIVEEHHLDQADIEALSHECFGKSVHLLNKVEASGLIHELLDAHGGGTNRNSGNNRPNGSAHAGSDGRGIA